MKKQFNLGFIVLLVIITAVSCGNSKPENQSAVSSVKEDVSQAIRQVEEYTGKTIEMKLAWAETADPKSHPTSAALTVFKAYAESLGGGKLKVELYPAGQLGDAKSMLEQVERGIIHSCASVPSGLVAGTYYDNFNIFDLPYLFRSNIVAWETLNPKNDFFKELTADMASVTGILPLGFFTEGRRHFTNSVREIRSPKDLQGLKIRTMEVPAHMEMVKAMGATPTPISWLELYSALQTGVVDGQENPVFNIQYLHAQEVQDYLTLDGHITLLNVWVVNNDWFAGLPESIRIAIKEAAYQALIVNRGLAELSNTVGVLELQNDGMKVYSPTKSELEEFRSVTQNSVFPWVKDNITNPEMLEKLQATIQNVENSLIVQ